MTKEQAIKFANCLKNNYRIDIYDVADFCDMVIKALEQPTTQEILSHIETGITATGQGDSYCVGFCNALIWLKACITHEEPQFFEDSKVSEISTGSTSDNDCVSREQAKIDVIPNSLYTSEQVIALLDNLSPVTPTHGMCKDCTKSKILNGFEGYSIVCSRFGRMAVNPDFYCADFEKRGNENV